MVPSGVPNSLILAGDLEYLESALRNGNQFGFTRWRTGRVTAADLDCTGEGADPNPGKRLSWSIGFQPHDRLVASGVR